MWSDWALEKQVARLYNRGIFYKFQQELMNSTKFHMVEVERNKQYEVFKSPTQALFEYNPKTFIVMVDIDSKTFTCICGKFEKDGILCCHALKVIQALNIDEIAEKYFIDRWRPNEKKSKQVSEQVTNLEDLDDQMAFFSFSRRLTELASEVSKNPARRKVMSDQITNLQKLILAIPCKPETEEPKSCSSEVASDTSAVLSLGSNSENTLKDPVYTKPKGRMKKIGRQKSIVEEILAKPKMTCSGCGKQGHRITGCKQTEEDATQKIKKRGNVQLLFVILDFKTRQV